MAVRKYELLALLDPVRTEEQQKETIEKMKGVLEKYGATVEKVDPWGKRRLAYPINRRKEGYYVVIIFDAVADGSALAELNRYCRITDEIFRHMVTHAVVGKSTGNPALIRDDRQPRIGGPRTLAGGPPSGPPRGPYTPRPAQPAEGGDVASATPPAPEAGEAAPTAVDAPAPAVTETASPDAPAPAVTESVSPEPEEPKKHENGSES